jgi:hypothetical protein
MLNLLVISALTIAAAVLIFLIIRSRIEVEEGNQYEDLLSEEEETNHLIRTAIYGDRAFWVHDNIFYESEVNVEPDWSTARPIDTMDLSPQSLNNLMNVLDALKNSERSG